MSATQDYDWAFGRMFRLKRPCNDCPFRKVGAIFLKQGAIEMICDGILKDDWAPFQCHKTTHLKDAMTFDDGTPINAQCVGSTIWLEKARRPSVAMRLATVFGQYDRNSLLRYYDQIIDP